MIGTVEGWRNHCQSLEKDIQAYEFELEKLTDKIRRLEVEKAVLMEVIQVITSAKNVR